MMINYILLYLYFILHLFTNNYTNQGLIYESNVTYFNQNLIPITNLDPFYLSNNLLVMYNTINFSKDDYHTINN
jgi:hypothetical protein